MQCVIMGISGHTRLLFANSIRQDFDFKKSPVSYWSWLTCVDRETIQLMGKTNIPKLKLLQIYNYIRTCSKLTI